MLLASTNPHLLNFVLLGLVIIGLGVVLRYFRQPYVVAYILAGVLIGEHGLQMVTDKALITSMGDIGLLLLLFFIGMEVNIPDLIQRWKLALFGTLMQILGSVGVVMLIGFWLDWDWSRMIILGFMISLSSSAVVIKLLQDRGEFQSDIGQSVISILLMQDILIVPMLIISNYLGNELPTVESMLLQVVGGILLIGMMIWIIRKKEIQLPFSESIEGDHELQVFVAFIFCFGFALITAFFGLSAALGAFVGGIVIHAARSTEWFHDSLHSFRVIFVALFFVSIGMLIDLTFLVEHWQVITIFVVAVFVTNHLINTLILRSFGQSWQDSFLGGALLAQVGELSFVLASGAFHAEIISDYGYHLTIIVISMTLLISPFWIGIAERIGRFNPLKNEIG